MNEIDVYGRFMECEKEFLVEYILHLDEWLTKYQDALDVACSELERLEKAYYWQSVKYKHCKSAKEWRKEILDNE